MTIKKMFTAMLVAVLAVGNHTLTAVIAEEEPAEVQTTETESEPEEIEETEEVEPETEVEITVEESEQRDVLIEDLKNVMEADARNHVVVSADEAEFPVYFDLRESGVVPTVEEGSGDVSAEIAILTAMGLTPEEFKETYGEDFAISIGDVSDTGIIEGNDHTAVYSLTDTNLLPSPAQIDEDGNYTYNENAALAIKSELISGHGVTISYHADDAESSAAEEEKDLKHIYMLEEIENVDDSAKLKYIEYCMGHADPYAMTVQEVQDLIRIRLALKGLDEDFYDLNEMTRDELADLLESRFFGAEDAPEEEDEAETYTSYLNVSGIVPAWAQYTYDAEAGPDTIVTIVGWDDDYAKENFLEDHQPEKNGAWIVRSNYSNEWGHEGYFYLSYYDMSISDVVSASYTVTEDEPVEEYGLQYDLSGLNLIHSSIYEEAVSTANVFTLEEDSVLRSVAVFTDEPQADVTVYVYCLNDDAQSPTDGVLLDCVNTKVAYGGYHLVSLNNHFALTEGARISVVTTQKIQDGDETKYVLVLAGEVLIDGSEEIIEEEPVEEETADEEEEVEEAAEETTEEDETSEIEEAEEAEEVSEEEEAAEENDPAAESEEEVSEEPEESADDAEESEDGEEVTEETESDEADAESEENTEEETETEEVEEEPEEVIEAIASGSYVSYDGSVWYSWEAEKQYLHEEVSDVQLLDMPIFLNICAFDDLAEVHSFGEPIPYMLGSMLICDEDGYTIIDLK